MAEPRRSPRRLSANVLSDLGGVALERYRSGDLRLAAKIALAALASGDTSPGFAELAARSAIRTGDAETMQAALAAMRPNPEGDPRSWMRAAFEARYGDAERAVPALRDAARAAHGATRTEIAYHLAVALWGTRDLEGSEAVVLAHIEDGTGFGLASLQQMLGWIEVSRERYVFAGRHFIDALATLDAAHEHDEWARSRAMHALAIIAVETLDLRPLPMLSVREGTAGEEAREPLFHVLQNVGWLRMLDGDENGALIDFERARAIAPTPSLVAVAEVNRASYFRIRGELGSARTYLQLAGDALRGQRWADANADERITLLEYALEAYYLEPTSAGPTLTRYLSGSRKRRAALAFEHDRREQAVELTARGALEAYHKRTTEAVHLLREALDVWGKIGYRYREALTALLLDDVSPREEFRDTARRATAGVPRSWLRREVDRRGARTESGYAALSPAERRVMLAICEGKTSKQIAADFGRSFHTIRNQTLKVYSTMGVRTRSALVAECARLGLLSKLR
ncbi:MAG TPA: helix-turn-helix transcriptional regulator [Candidatus Elarobacter sp.]|jgi:DNA-binding CsgD family transcriptional regulator/tetratricopeptide (TPR) repeat protein|nr:helix-turn-helix transcriptional regulator [Candidatus Elarobacter sp.]